MSSKCNPWPPLIPRVLDDAGLNAAEFRIICRIARRGECFDAASTIAADCKLSQNTVWSVLKRLEKWRMIGRESRHGDTSIFRILPVEEWALPMKQPGANEEATLPQTRRWVAWRKAGGGEAHQSRRHRRVPTGRKGSEDDNSAHPDESDDEKIPLPKEH